MVNILENYKTVKKLMKLLKKKKEKRYKMIKKEEGWCATLVYGLALLFSPRLHPVMAPR